MKHLLLAVFLVTGCASFLPPENDPSPSPNTSWTLARARYSVQQHEAAAYAQRCDRDPSLFLSNCRAIVHELNGVDLLAERVERQGVEALVTGDNARLSQAVNDLDHLGGELERILRKERLN